jgi:acetylornithine deacetylase/succinyl-diaminopimelate desuccinylase-like protein
LSSQAIAQQLPPSTIIGYTGSNSRGRTLPESKQVAVEKRLFHVIEQALPNSLQRLSELLRFASVGTDPTHAADCLAAAAWLKADLSSLGFSVDVMPSTGQPIVLATSKPDKSRRIPHILFYGHYDVQPADPFALWTHDPFDPQVRRQKNGRDAIFARGASDDKGQLMTFIEASRAWIGVHGSLPFKLTILLEGDEEGDNSVLDDFVQQNRKRLSADVAFICDTEMWDTSVPSIVTALRGCIAEEVFVQGPRIDLHSGMYGGAAVNPIRALSKIIASLHDAHGRVTIPGFYKGVKDLTPAMRRQLKRTTFNERDFMRSAGLSQSAGEKGYNVLEQRWFRPTCEVNGLIGGYTGSGSKTVLPAEASAKFTFRLVESQDPRAIRRAFHSFVRKHLLPDCKVSFASTGGNSTGVRVADDSDWIAIARAALKAEWGRDPVIAADGGSIPVVESFKTHLGMDSLLMGFSMADDNAHSPDEKYDIRSFHKGINSWARVIAAIHERNIKYGDARSSTGRGRRKSRTKSRATF